MLLKAVSSKDFCDVHFSAMTILTALGSSLFGNKTQTAFGSSFSQPQSSGTTGLFGNTATNTGGGLFGGSASGSLFGQQTTTQCKKEAKLKIFKRSFSRTGAIIWNQISSNWRDASKPIFKKIIRRFLFETLSGMTMLKSTP